MSAEPRGAERRLHITTAGAEFKHYGEAAPTPVLPRATALMYCTPEFYCAAPSYVAFWLDILGLGLRA
jgi:hypothetical protein